MKTGTILIFFQIGIVLFGALCHVSAQNESDTLQKSSHPKLQELKNYIQWSSSYASQKEFDSANHYTAKARRLAQELNDIEQTAGVNFNEAKVLYYQANTKDAKPLLQKNIENKKLSDSTKLVSYLLYSEILSYQQNYTEALEQNINAEKLIRKKEVLTNRDSMRLTDSYVMRASVHRKLHNFEQALQTYDQALASSVDPGFRSYILFYKSEVHSENENLQAAIDLTLEALELAKQNNKKVYLPTYYLALSEYYLKLKQSDKAIYYASAGLKGNDDCHIDGLNFSIGKSYAMQMKHSEAVHYFNAALHSENIEVPQTEIHKSLSETYSSMGKHKDAMRHMSIFLKLKDSIDALKLRQEVIDITEKYESEKKEIEIEMLNSKDAYNNFVIKKQQSQLWLTSLSLILALALMGLITWFYFQQKKQKFLLYEKNVQLAQKLKSASEQASNHSKIGDQINKNEALSITASKKDELNSSVEELITKEFYLDPDMTLVKMAKLMNTNTTYLSKIINEDYKISFANFINDLRITNALRNLESNPEFKKLTIEHISEKVGFASSSAFYNAFKRFTGLTPSYYIKKRLQRGY